MPDARQRAEKALAFIREIAANKCQWTPEEGTSSCDGLGGICVGHRAETWLAGNAETAPAPPQAREVEAAAEGALVTLRNGAAHLLAMKDGAHNCRGCGLLHDEWREAATLLESALARGAEPQAREVEALAAALAPFAAYGRRVDPHICDDAPIGNNLTPYLTFGDVRRAAEALAALAEVSRV